MTTKDELTTYSFSMSFDDEIAGLARNPKSSNLADEVGEKKPPISTKEACKTTVSEKVEEDLKPEAVDADPEDNCSIDHSAATAHRQQSKVAAANSQSIRYFASSLQSIKTFSIQSLRTMLRPKVLAGIVCAVIGLFSDILSICAEALGIDVFESKPFDEQALKLKDVAWLSGTWLPVMGSELNVIPEKLNEIESKFEDENWNFSLREYIGSMKLILSGDHGEILADGSQSQLVSYPEGLEDRVLVKRKILPSMIEVDIEPVSDGYSLLTPDGGDRSFEGVSVSLLTEEQFAFSSLLADTEFKYIGPSWVAERLSNGKMRVSLFLRPHEWSQCDVVGDEKSNNASSSYMEVKIVFNKVAGPGTKGSGLI